MVDVVNSRVPKFVFCLLSVVLFASCGVKKEKLIVSRSYAQAKTLSHQQILDLFHKIFTQHKTLIIKKATLTFIAQSKRLRRREILPSVSGVIILNRNGDLRLRIYTPMIKTTAVDVVARYGKFQIWYPRKKTLYKGSIEDDLDKFSLPRDSDGKSPRYNLSRLRPWHVSETFFHSRLKKSSDFLIYQEDTAIERYYVLEELLPEKKGRMKIIQKFWLERASLRIRKKILFTDDGVPISIIVYRGYNNVDDLPAEIVLRRPLEGYQVVFKIKRYSFDVPLKDSMFELKLPKKIIIKNIHTDKKR